MQLGFLLFQFIFQIVEKGTFRRAFIQLLERHHIGTVDKKRQVDDLPPQCFPLSFQLF